VLASTLLPRLIPPRRAPRTAPEEERAADDANESAPEPFRGHRTSGRLSTGEPADPGDQPRDRPTPPGPIPTNRGVSLFGEGVGVVVGHPNLGMRSVGTALLVIYNVVVGTHAVSLT